MSESTANEAFGPNARTYLEFEEALGVDTEEALMGCLEAWLVFTANQSRVRIGFVTDKIMKLKAYHCHLWGVRKEVALGNFEQTRRFLAEVAFYLCRERGVDGAERYLNPMVLAEAVKVLRNHDRPQRAKADPQTLDARKAAQKARKLATSTAGPEKGSNGAKPAPTGGKTKNARKRSRAKA
ncbi:MAG: hypothetical protein WCI63_00740 [bacterium]